jgi:arylsulfatase
VLDATLKYMDKVGKGDKPFFVWFNTTATHIWSHPTKKYIQMAVDEGRAESDVVRAKMIEHDEQVGRLLKNYRLLSTVTSYWWDGALVGCGAYR